MKTGPAGTQANRRAVPYGTALLFAFKGEREPCTLCRLRPSSLPPSVGSHQETPYPPRSAAYGCCLPTLTRFTVPRRTGPSAQHLVTIQSCKAKPRKGIQPRCGGLRVQGTASSPSSTTMKEYTLFRALLPPFSVLNTILLAGLLCPQATRLDADLHRQVPAAVTVGYRPRLIGRS